MKTKIKNAREYEVALGWLHRCQRVVDDVDDYQEGVSPVLIKAHHDSMEYRLKKLQEEVDEYECHNPNDPSVLRNKARRYSRDLPKVAGQ